MPAHPLRRLILIAALLALTGLGCKTLSDLPGTQADLPAATPTPLFAIPVQPGDANPDEPVFIRGEIPYTSPFFLNTISQPFVLLEDQAGFVHRDREFTFRLAGQAIGPVEIQAGDRLTYSLPLPAVPQGTLVDIDNNGQSDLGVQVFAVAYWSNTWGGPFLEERDGSGWSTAYASTITDPENEDELKGGILVVWAPDDRQAFPTGFGADGLLFTDDDPAAAIPAGYNIVDLNQEPFQVFKESRPEITLNEGEIAVNDYSDLSYGESFEALFEKASREYPFTEEKDIDWQALYDEFAPRVAGARNADEFYRAVRDFTWSIPDGHVGVSTFNPQVFLEDSGGGFGLVLARLSDGRVIATDVLPDTPGERAGIQRGAEILTWGDQPVSAAIDQVVPYFGPYSTDHTRRVSQVNFLNRVPPRTQVDISFQNPGAGQPQQANLTAEVEYESLFRTIPAFNQDQLSLPVEARVLAESGLGYIQVNTFSDDYQLMASLWERHIEGLIDNQVPGLIIDLRANGGGSGGLALDFAGYFFDEELTLARQSYYNERLGGFEYVDIPSRIKPAPLLYEGPVAVLVSPDCVSACEGFAHALSQGGRSIVVGHYPTAGAFGEVGRGQYKLPEDIELQFPTGRPETLDGALLIEGSGVVPDITVPVTAESALGQVDAVLQAAVQALQERLR